MKRNVVVTMVALAFVLGLISFVSEAARQSSVLGGTAWAAESKLAKGSEAPHKVVVYYFHGTVRCSSCRRIEAYTDEAIRRYFAEPIKDGRLEWRVINVDEPANEHFAKDYQLYTKSVIISEVQGDRQIRWKNLDKVWLLLDEEEAFTNYIRDEVDAYLKGI